MGGSIQRFLFGGNEQKQESRPVDVTPSEFVGLRGPLAGTFGGLISDPPTFTGPLTTSPTGAQTRLLGQTATLGGGQGTDLLTRTLAGNFLPGQPGSNPFLTAAIEAAQGPTRRALEDTLSRTLPGTFTAAGHTVSGGLRDPRAGLPGARGPGSTAFDLAAARAFEGGSRSLADIATNISAANFEQERARQQGAIQLGQNEVQTLIANLTAQGLPEMIERLNVERGQTQFNQQIAQLLQILQLATGAASPHVGQASTGTAEGTGGLLPALGSFLRGAGTGGTRTGQQ